MSSIALEMQRQKEERAAVLETSTRAESAYILARMAIDHSGSASEAAARLLLSLEYGQLFNLQQLLRFDTKNRAHAEIVIAGAVAHEMWPSQWMSDIDHDGAGIMQQVRNKWKLAE